MPTIRQPTTRLLMDWLGSHYPQGGYRTNVPLGPTVAQALAGGGPATDLLASRPFRPKADALIFEPTRIVLVEAKDMEWVDGLGALCVYRSLVPETEELRAFAGRPLEGWLLVPWTIPAALAAAKRLDLKVVVWTPDWYAQRVKDLNDYWTPEATQARHERKQVLRALGLDGRG